MNRMALWILLALPAFAARAADTNLNAATLYAPVFSNITAWAGANSNFSFTSTNYSSPQAKEAYVALRPEVDALSGAREATHCDWGTRFEDGVAATLPYVGPARKASMAAQWVASYEAANGLPQSGAHAIESLRLARNVGEDRLLISLLVQIAGEKRALDFLADRAGALDAKELDALERKLAALPPGSSMVEAMQMEKAMFIDNLIRQVMEAMRAADTNLFEVVADGADGAALVGRGGAGASDGGRRPSWLSENLRLTSIVESGGRYRIGFETRDGDSFVLSLGRPQRGIEMLAADMAREEAVIARGPETAIVKLKSREIAPIRLRLRLPPPEQARTLLDGPPGAVTNAAQQLLLTLASRPGPLALGELTGGTADGLMRLLRKTSDEYEEWIAAFQRLSPDAFRDWMTTFLKTATPLTQSLLPAVDKCAEKEKQLLAARERLAAALAARRAELRK